jgi:alpha-methylacyl-CoA racemase
VFGDSDACVWPVLTMGDALHHPLNEARGVFADVGGVTLPGPAPRFSRSVPAAPRADRGPGADTDVILSELGYTDETIRQLRRAQITFSG